MSYFSYGPEKKEVRIPKAVNYLSTDGPLGGRKHHIPAIGGRVRGPATMTTEKNSWRLSGRGPGSLPLTPLLHAAKNFASR